MDGENLAAFCGNIFRCVETLPRFAAGFQRQYACRRHFLFAYVRAYAIRPYSFWRKTKYIMVTLPAYFAIVSGDGSAVANGSI